LRDLFGDVRLVGSLHRGTARASARGDLQLVLKVQAFFAEKFSLEDYLWDVELRVASVFFVVLQNIK